MRKSERIREPPRDPFAKDFVGKEWAILRGRNVSPVKQGGQIQEFRTESGSNLKDRSPEVLEESVEMATRIIEEGLEPSLLDLQTENSTLHAVIELQNERIRILEGKNTYEIRDGVTQKLEDLMSDLMAAKNRNMKLRLDMNVLAEKVLVNEAGATTSKSKEVNSQAMGVPSKYDLQFPELPSMVGQMGVQRE